MIFALIKKYPKIAFKCSSQSKSSTVKFSLQSDPGLLQSSPKKKKQLISIYSSLAFVSLKILQDINHDQFFFLNDKS